MQVVVGSQPAMGQDYCSSFRLEKEHELLPLPRSFDQDPRIQLPRLWPDSMLITFMFRCPMTSAILAFHKTHPAHYVQLSLSAACDFS
jgi:hypothetical protein